jgi:hypothetical protein
MAAIITHETCRAASTLSGGLAGRSRRGQAGLPQTTSFDFGAKGAPPLRTLTLFPKKSARMGGHPGGSHAGEARSCRAALGCACGGANDPVYRRGNWPRCRNDSGRRGVIRRTGTRTRIAWGLRVQNWSARPSAHPIIVARISRFIGLSVSTSISGTGCRLALIICGLSQAGRWELWESVGARLLPKTNRLPAGDVGGLFWRIADSEGRMAYCHLPSAIGYLPSAT